MEHEPMGFGDLPLQLQSSPENPWPALPVAILSLGTVLLRMELSKHQSPVSTSCGLGKGVRKGADILNELSAHLRQHLGTEEGSQKPGMFIE